MNQDQNQITYKISYISRILKRHIDQETYKYGLTVEQGRTILYLHAHKDESIHLTDLENVFHLRKSSLTSLINNLEKNGYVNRVLSKSDLRLKRIELTELGEEKVQLLLQSFKDGENKVREGLSEDESSILLDLLNKVSNNVNNF